MQRVFVYGTLLPHQHNHHLLANARALGAAQTLSLFRMFDTGRGYPGVKVAGNDSGFDKTEVVPGGYPIIGAVYDVDARHMATLDVLEGYREEGGGLYDRRRVPVAALTDTGSEGAGGEAWIYTFNGDTRFMAEILSGDWRSWSAGLRTSEGRGAPLRHGCALVFLSDMYRD